MNRKLEAQACMVECMKRPLASGNTTYASATNNKPTACFVKITIDLGTRLLPGQCVLATCNRLLLTACLRERLLRYKGFLKGSYQRSVCLYGV